MWLRLPAHREVTWDAQGYWGYVGHGRGCGESSVSLDPTMHNSAPVVGAGVPGPGLGFWECGEEGWMTGFNNRWDHEGTTADESRGKDGMWRFAAARGRACTQRANPMNRAREKREGKKQTNVISKIKKATQTRDISGR